MQRGFAQLLIPLLITIVIVGGLSFYFFSSRNKGSLLIPKIISSPKPQFNSYSNPKLGLGFKTDKDLVVKEDTEEEFNKRGNGDFRKNYKGYVGYEPGEFLGAVVVLDKSQSYDINPFTLWIFDNLNNLSIDNWYKNYWYYPFVWGDFTYTGKQKLAPKEEATVSGQLAKIGLIDYQPGKPKFVYIAKDKQIYLFRLIGEKGEKILSSFNFLSNTDDRKDNKCIITGCSKEICSDQDTVTPCVYLPKYACYQQASCQEQDNGKCGWTVTEELQQCLNKY